MSDPTSFTRVQLDESVTNKLRSLKGQTGLARNHLCRIALCYSLREPQPVQPGEYDAEGQELNRSLLLGDHDPLYIALVQERLRQENRELDEEYYEQFVAHINRGVEQITRVDDLTDLYDLVPGELKATA